MMIMAVAIIISMLVDMEEVKGADMEVMIAGVVALLHIIPLVEENNGLLFYSFEKVLAFAGAFSFIFEGMNEKKEMVPLKLVTVKHRPERKWKMEEPGTWPLFLQFLFYPKPLGKEQFFSLRIVIWIAMIFFSVQIWREGYDAWIMNFLHCINLPVHEAGHVVFGFFGSRLLTTLGGSLFQVMMPLVFCFALWIKPRDILGASVGLWWAFQNCVDVAMYIGDALPMKLPLINGVTGAESPYGFHDWNYILGETGKLIYYDDIERWVLRIAFVGMFLCILWAAWSLFYYRFYQRKDSKSLI